MFYFFFGTSPHLKTIISNRPLCSKHRKSHRRGFNLYLFVSLISFTSTRIASENSSFSVRFQAAKSDDITYWRLLLYLQEFLMIWRNFSGKICFVWLLPILDPFFRYRVPTRLRPIVCTSRRTITSKHVTLIFVFLNSILSYCAPNTLQVFLALELALAETSTRNLRSMLLVFHEIWKSFQLIRVADQDLLVACRLGIPLCTLSALIRHCKHVWLCQA